MIDFDARQTMNYQPELILASQSPRRHDLLVQYGYSFRVVVPSEGAECGICSRETPSELVARLAFQKGKDVALRSDAGMILACDTVAECEGQILGKPKNRNHAQQMLKLMQGQEHRVLSGVCLWQRPENLALVEVEVSRLKMDAIDDEQLEDYLDTDAWEGKAGAFGFQDGLDWVHLLDGSASNVVGLPMERLADMLKRFHRDAVAQTV